MITLIELFNLARSVIDLNLLSVLLIPALLISMHYHDRLTAIGRIASFSVILAVVLIFGFKIVRATYSRIINPPVWDFQCFWLHGNVVVRGLDFYEPQNYHDTAQSLNLNYDEGFSQETLDVGSLYPPMTMFLFAPLGWFDIQTAALLWYILQSVILVIDIFLLWKLFLGNFKLVGLAFTFALVLMFPPIIHNIVYAQLNFIVLFMLLLFWRDRQLTRSGIWLGIGIIVKPYLALLLVYLFVNRKWRTITSALLTLSLASLLSLIAFGSTTFFDYFTSNPVIRLPAWFFSELGNGSLYAIIWRLITRYLGSGSLGLVQPIFISASIILIAFTVWLVYQLGSSYDEWALAIILSLALLLYPDVGSNYCVALTAPLLLLWTNRKILLGGIWSVAAFITLESALFGYNSGWNNFVFISIALNWLAFSAFGLLFLLQQRKQSNIAA